MAQAGSFHVSDCKVLKIVQQTGIDTKDHWLQILVDGDHILTVFGPIEDGTWELPRVEMEGLTQLSIPNVIKPSGRVASTFVPVVIRVEDDAFEAESEQ